uniref:Uncharacterized protein n=1 Tax=Rhizophora mucronata TaxID=61149 RepID=A0A2P2P5F9_RHIMU
MQITTVSLDLVCFPGCETPMGFPVVHVPPLSDVKCLVLKPM